MNGRIRHCASFVLALAAVCSVAAAESYPAWTYRTHVRLQNAAGSENLADFPVLVKLSAANFDFAKASATGSDIRFTDRFGTPLSYEIERWDSGAQQAAVWVKVPQVDKTSAVNYVNLYHGNAAAADAQSPADVWSNGYKGVWHLGSSTADSTGRHDGTITGTGVSTVDGVIGEANYFAGDGSRILARSLDLGAASSLDAGDNITLSYWMNASSSQPGTYTRTIAKNVTPGWETQRDSANPNQRFRIDTSAQTNQVKNAGNGVFNDAWHCMGVTLAAGTMKAYVDAGSAITSGYNHGTGFANTSNLSIGANPGGGAPYRGLLDEVRFSDVARSEAWMNAEYRSQAGLLAGITGSLDRSAGAGPLASYTHEQADPLTDVTGHGFDAVNGGGVAFVTPPSAGQFVLGDRAGQYARGGNQYLNVPQVAGAGEDFTFTAAVRKNADETGGHQTILSSNRFRFQFNNTGSTADGAGQLRLDINGAGAGGSNVGPAGGFLTEEWYFVALRYDADTQLIEAFLQDGNVAQLQAPVITRTVNGTLGLDDINALRVGSDGLSGIGSGDTWGGWIDNVQFFNDYLSNQEIENVFLADSTVPEPLTLLTLGLLAPAALGRYVRRRRA